MDISEGICCEVTNCCLPGAGLGTPSFREHVASKENCILASLLELNSGAKASFLSISPFSLSNASSMEAGLRNKTQVSELWRETSEEINELP